jgi:hypothetical protein
MAETKGLLDLTNLPPKLPQEFPIPSKPTQIFA